MTRARTAKSKPDAEPPKKAGKGRLVLFAVLGVVLLFGGIGGGIYASRAGLLGEAAAKEDPKRPKLVERSDDAPEAGAEGEAPAPRIGTVAVNSDRDPVDPRRFAVTYFPIEQPFTANLAGSGGFVQLSLSLATYYDDRVVANIRRQSVPIRSAVLMVLSQQTPEVVATAKGKERLQHDIADAINTVLREKEGFGGIDDVYFTSLVIQ